MMKMLRRVCVSGLLVAAIASGQLPGVIGVAGTGRTPTSIQQDDVVASQFSFVNPRQIYFDAAANLYINDVLWVTVIDPLGKVRYAALPPEGGDGRINAIAVDGAGQLYILAQRAACVLKRLVNGRVVPFAGRCGTPGDSGDGGPAVDARLVAPETVAADRAGNVYIWDASTSRVRRVTPAGIISTFHQARPAALGDFGRTVNMAVDRDGALYFAQNSQPILKITADGASEFLNLQSGPPMAFDAAGVFHYYSLPGEFRNSLSPTLARRNADGSLALVAGGGPSPAEGSPANNADLGNSEGFAFGPDGSFYYPTGSPRLTAGPQPDPLFYRIRRINNIGAIRARCIYSVPPRLNAPLAGGPLNIDVTVTPSDCSWNAVADDNWVQIPADLGVKTGSGNFTVTVAPNPSRERTTNVTVFGQPVQIVQSGEVMALPTLSMVQNAASGIPGLASNQWISIFGTNFARENATWDNAITADGRLPTELSGVRVRVAGRECYVAFVSPTQINALIPPDLSGAGQVEVITAAGTARSANRETVAAIAPSFFTYSYGGVLYAAAVHPDGVLVAPTASGFGRPAKPGDIVLVYANALGVTTPRAPIGRTFTEPLRLETQARLDLAQRPMDVLFAGLVAPGLYQLNIRIPAGTSAGNQPLRLSIGLPETVAPLVSLPVEP